MKTFRKTHPIRRTDVTVRTDYKLYRDDLKRDFNSRCGYTDCADRWWGVKFQVDHFAPQNPKNIEPENLSKFADLKCNYSNLVYSCPQVNNAKRNLWVTQDPDEPINESGDEGLLDPCTFDYNEYFERSSDGRILPKNDNPIAKFMISKLKLYLLRYEIYWRIEEIYECKQRLHALRQDQNVMRAHSAEINELIAELDQEFNKYFDYIGINHNQVA